MGKILLAFLAGCIGMLLLLVVAVRFVLPRILGRVAKKFAVGLFEAKASALKGADTELLVVEVAERPALTSAPVDRCGRWLRVQARITPRRVPDQKFTMWEPTELSLIATSVLRGERLNLEDLNEESGIHVERVRLTDWDRSLCLPEPCEQEDSSLRAGGESGEGTDCASGAASVTAGTGEGEDAPDEDQTPDKIAGPGTVELLAFIPVEVPAVRLHYYNILLGSEISPTRLIEGKLPEVT